MENENQKQHRENLCVQLREAFGRIVFSYTTHLKKMNHLHAKDEKIKILQICLSAISTGGFLGAIITNQQSFTVVGGLFSTALLALNLFLKNYNLLEEIKQHQNTAIDLWMVREDYISLLTDFPTLSTKDLASKRDDLQKKTYEIYKSSPLTDKESYREAQKALKSEEEQFFTPEEIDKILPSHLRVKIGGNK